MKYHVKVDTDNVLTVETYLGKDGSLTTRSNKKMLFTSKEAAKAYMKNNFPKVKYRIEVEDV